MREEEEKEYQQQQTQQQQQGSTEDEPQGATSGRGLQNWGPPHRRNINIHPFVSPAKRMKQTGSTHQQRQLSTVCMMLFFTETELYTAVIREILFGH
jgi:hypothetical protein